MANVEQILDELRAGLKAGNVHAVKRATNRIIRMGLDPDLQLRAEQPLIERTLQILLRRGKEYQDSAHGPSQHFRTVAHIIDTLTPKDWPGITKILDDNKHEIVRDLLLRMREGWTASAMIAAKDLQRWGQRWPELATIIHTAETDVDSSVDESRDDHTPGTESLLRYLRQDLDRGDYDAAMEMIGELAWPTHASMDLSALLNPHKTGLMRAMLTTMSTNDSEGMRYIMPQYLGGFAKLGVHWPEFETIERSVAAMGREPQDDDVHEGYAFGRPAPDEINDLFYALEHDDGIFAVASLHRLRNSDLDRGYAEDLMPHKDTIIRGLLRWAKEEDDWEPIVLYAIDTLHKLGIDWPEVAAIRRSAVRAMVTRNDLDETNLAYVKQDAEQQVRGVSANLRKMQDQEIGWFSYHRLVDASYGVMGVPRGYVDLLTPVLDHHKTQIMQNLLWVIKHSYTSSSEPYQLQHILDGLDRARVTWPELAAIKRSLGSDSLKESAGIAESTMDPHQLRYITQTLDNHTPWKAAGAMIQQGLRYDSNAEIKALWDANKDRTIVHMLKLIKADPNHKGIPLMIKDFKTIGLPWSEIDGIARSISAGIAEAESDHVRESITVGEESPEELIAQLEQDLAAADHEAALHTLDDLYFHDDSDLAVLLDAHKQGIMRELLKFIKDASTADPVDRAMAARITHSLRKHGARWPELAIITRSLKAIDGIQESWSKKYKKSINCSHPKGFSQKAHCAARRKRRAGGKTKSKSVSESIRGQQRFIQRVADQLQHDLEHGDWTAANYTVQRLNQTDPQEVQEIFEPLAPLFAKMINADPMGTLNYMNRIMVYVDHAYPEVTAAYDENKTAIMQDLLKMVRSGEHQDWVRTQIQQLRNCGVDWKELNVITRSLLESQDTTQSELLGTEGREMVLDIFRRKLADGGQRGIYYVMYHMDDWGLKLSDWPELAEMIEDHKREIVRELLRIVNGDFGNDPRENRHSARFTIDRLRRIGMTWPELDVILKSIDADSRLNEDGDFEEIAEVIASHMYDMAAFLAEGEDLWLVGALSDIYITLENENLRYWPNPEDYDIDVDAHKINFVKGILGAIKQGEGDEAVNAVHMLRDYWHVSWPELDIILKSANADQTKQLDELKGYRADPVYAASQKEFIPSKMKTASERDMAMEKLTDYLETQGFKHIGWGSFSSVYLKDGYPWMFKLWSHDPAYLWWITWAAKHQDNPNVPRVKGLPVKIAPDTYVVRLEKLRGLVPRKGNLSKGYDRLAYLLDRIETVDDLSKEDLQWIRSEYPGVYDILRVIQRAGSDFVVDLHGDNIMLRGQVPVITDPVVG